MVEINLLAHPMDDLDLDLIGEYATYDRRALNLRIERPGQPDQGLCSFWVGGLALVIDCFDRSAVGLWGRVAVERVPLRRLGPLGAMNARLEAERGRYAPGEDYFVAAQAESWRDPAEGILGFGTWNAAWFRFLPSAFAALNASGGLVGLAVARPELLPGV